MDCRGQTGVPSFAYTEYMEKSKEYVVLIPVINEGDRIIKELTRACENKVSDYADIVICDGGSTDGSTNEAVLQKLRVNTQIGRAHV